ncbi:MAG TPA: porin [Polyangiaceae bacterium]
MWLSRKQASVFVFLMAGLAQAGVATAEVPLVEAGGWTVTTDGRVNSFVSHVWGDNRPQGLGALNWVGFNESNADGEIFADGKLRKTRIRSGYVPSTLAFNLRKPVSKTFTISGRVEIGFQITNVQQSFVANPTWMDPRAVYLDLAGSWGSVRAGRDFGFFSRGNLFMNYELGHAYGLGFPCAYATMFGGACGHVGFGTLWPDFHAQISYSTPWFGDIFQVSAGIFDPRSIEASEWHLTPTPRFEGEAIAKYNWKEGWGLKAFANGAFQTVGVGFDERDPVSMEVTGRKERFQNAYGFGGGIQAYLGPFKAGFAGYSTRGSDAFEFLSFNPIIYGRANTIPDGMGGTRQARKEDRVLRTSQGFLAHASFTLGNTWFMGGFGRALVDRIPEDGPLETPNTAVLRTQTGISVGAFHRIENVVIGLDYFNAHYGFDPLNIGTETEWNFIDIEQRVQIVNGGVTLEW